MIAELHVVTAHAQDVLDADGGPCQKIGLQGEAIPIAASQMHDRLSILIQDLTTHGPWAHAHDRAMVVRDTEGVNHVFEFLYELTQAFNISPLRGIDTCGRQEPT
jgi:hypothetical protein